jgi:phosphatidylglycerol:prolipoprotein diacylglycerol transferase
MIPYFDQPVWHFGPITIHAFGVTVAAAFWLGMTLAQRRFARLGLDATTGQRLGTWTIVGGIAGAHLFSLLFYFPEKLLANPLTVFRVWEDISSFGGMIGGVLGAGLFFSVRATAEERRNALAYLDVIAFVFPASLAVGRFGCALAHDHPGKTTTFPLAIRLPDGTAFHDLGLYEFLFLTLVMVPAFALLDRRRRPAGFFLAAFAAIYMPVRFGLDTLRTADARYIGLTPAQWTAALIVATLPFVAIRNRKLRFAITGAVALATAWACK